MRVKTQARMLFELSLDDRGGLDASRVASVCRYIDGAFGDAPSRLRILRAYRKMLETEMEKESALIESAGELPPKVLSQLEEMILKKKGSAKISKKISPELLAGVRVRIGDEIFENSARQSLESGILKNF